MDRCNLAATPMAQSAPMGSMISGQSSNAVSLYIAECEFKHNNRFNDDIFGTAIEGC
jgi:hypothetical protein